MKYRPSYPGTFATIEEARAYVDAYVPWYNVHHKHSGIALFSPNEVHDGTWREAWTRRDPAAVLRQASRTLPATTAHARPADIVGINRPNEDENPKAEVTRLQTA